MEEFAADVRKYTQVLTEMIRRHDERLEEHEQMFRETNEALTALADAQIRTEDTLNRLIQRLDRDDGGQP